MIKFSRFFNIKYAVVFSLILGFINWLVFYIIIPINNTKLSFKTISFILCSVICFISGYYLFKFNKQKKLTVKPINFFILFTGIALVGLMFRYIDLFFIRDVNLSNTFNVNKYLKSNNATKAHLLILLLGTLRVLYFIPLLILIIQKTKKKMFWFFSILLVIFNSIEVFLFGTRKPFFYLALLILIALFYYNRKKIRLSKKNIVISLTSLCFLGALSFFILNKRVNQNHNESVSLIEVTNSRYNDFVKIKAYKLNKLKETPNSLNTKSQIIFIHIGQYIVHGFFELDYIIRNDFPRALGIYSFNPIYKFLNYFNDEKKDLNTNENHPRNYVYTTFFGSLFIDFGWFALIFMFLFGAFQRWIFTLAKFNIVAKVFAVVLLAVNFSMPIFNLLAGAGLYLFICLLIITCYSLKTRNTKLSIELFK